MLGSEILCMEEKRCYFEDWKYDRHIDKQVKCCRLLTDPDDQPPYKNGECKFYKKTKNSYSGNHDGEEYSPELINKIRNAEYEYKMRKGIIGRRGRVI